MLAPHSSRHVTDNMLLCRQSTSVGCRGTRLPALLSWYHTGRSSLAARGPAAGKSVMIVESPAKAEKIQKFLGSNYEVLASYGHLIDLAQRPGAVQPEADWALRWEVQRRGAQQLAVLAAAAGRADEVLLATDPDREGEAISWHLLQELQRRGALPQGRPVKRVTFTEVTQRALQDALQHKRDLDQPLVDAYLARRCLDWLVGFTISPLLWTKLQPARSAGRVQSVALRLVCEREAEIEAFVPVDYWTLGAELAAARGQPPGSFTAKLVQVDGGKLQKLDIATQQQADDLEQRLRAATPYTVASVTRKPTKRTPPPPLITSTLQREAASRLGWGTKKTMQVAQQLYEGAGAGEGLITYMRTDGVTLSPEAVQDIRDAIRSTFGPTSLPPKPRTYKSKAKNAQEAHEAIRPTSMARAPEQLPDSCSSDQRRLYELIWRRTMACQMSDAALQQVTVEVTSPNQDLLLRTSSTTLTSPGFLAVYGDPAAAGTGSRRATGRGGGADAADVLQSEGEEGEELGEAGAAAAGGGRAAPELHALLQCLQVGDKLLLQQVLSAAAATRPPPRYSEASMVRALEESGIGRPSTYATVISTLLARKYVVKEGASLVPQPLGRLLVGLLVGHLGRYVEVGFTSDMENNLDEVSGGRLAWKQLLDQFWGPFQGSVQQVKGLTVKQLFDELDHVLEPWILHTIREHNAMQQQQQRGLTHQQGDAASGDPDVDSSSSRNATSSTLSHSQLDYKQQAGGAAEVEDLRRCPQCGGRLCLKPSRGMGGFIGCSNYSTNGCQFAISLINDPGALHSASPSSSTDSDDPDATSPAAAAAPLEKLLGHDPETGSPVLLKKGPYGLYIQKGGGESGAPLRRTAVTPAAAAKLDLEGALAALALPRELGPHPTDGAPVMAGSGRFGPYVQHHALYVQLPKEGPGPLEVDLATALGLIQAKVDKAQARGRDPYQKKAKKSGAATKNDRVHAAMAGYHLFMRERRQQLLQEQPGAALKELKAAAGEEWKQMEAMERQRWVEKAAAEKAEAAAAAGGPGGGSSDGEALPSVAPASGKGRKATRSSASSKKTKAAAGSQVSKAGKKAAAAAAPGGGRVAAKRGTKPATAAAAAAAAPTRAPSAYTIFVQQQGKELLQLPENKGKRMMQVTAMAWKSMSAKQKQPFLDLAAAPHGKS